MKALFQSSSRSRALGISMMITAVIATCCCLLRRTSLFSDRVEVPLYDALTRLTWPWSAGHADIALVTIQDPSPQSWPVSDGKLADAFQSILNGGASVIGVDLVRDAPVPDRMESGRTYDVVGSERLARLAMEHGNIVWVRGLLGKFPFPPPDFLDEAVLGEEEVRFRSPFADFPADADLAVRRAYASCEESPGVGHHSFAALLAKTHLKLKLLENPTEETPDLLDAVDDRFYEAASLDRNAGGYRLDGFRSRREIGSQFLLKFTENLDSIFPVVSLQSALSREARPPAPEPGDAVMPVYALEDLPAMDPQTLERCFKGRIVLIGTHDPRTAEDEKTIVGNRHLRGVRLHAIATAQLLREAGAGEAPITYTSDATEDGSVILAALFAAACVWLLPLPPMWKSALVPVGTAGISFGAAYFAMKDGLWFPPGAAMTSGFFSASAALAVLLRAESRDRTAIYQVFERHVGREIARKIWSCNEQLLRDGHLPSESFEVTALFSDLRGYSGISEGFYQSGRIDEFVFWLNSYLKAMVAVVHAHKGFIKQFSGDGIFVVFGFPPDDSSSHAAAAVDCALAMERTIQQLNQSLPSGIPHYQVRVGIYTGGVRAASLGGAGQFDYAFLGPTINKASRLEGLDKGFFPAGGSPVRILISDPTAGALPRDPMFRLESYPGNPVDLKAGAEAETVWIVTGEPRIFPQVSKPVTSVS